MPSQKPTIILVHGLWSDGSSWSEIIPMLRAEGHDVIATQLPLSSLQDDIAAVQRALDRTDAPIVLVGHSYGGFVITAAGVDERVKALVYVAALGPDTGDTGTVFDEDFDPVPLFAQLDTADGYLWMKKTGIPYFCGDLDHERQELIYATQGPASASLFEAPLDGEPAWKAKPSWYIVATEDQAINPARERRMAHRMGATVTELKSSHVAMMSQPEAVMNVILDASSSMDPSGHSDQPIE